ncbi:MAG: biotin transport system substrate-specific component [Gaiellales bacterium]|jgi:biotin transport system substrate-specific component|nr:biotin transport system substrate-specific component [Gaiellales bacterium]MDX6578463.1 biotin transport system substrate-specific component [Gaiellales bacterium]
MSSNVASRPTLSTAVLARSTWLSEAILLGAGVLLVALSAQVTIHLPGTPVPISGQTFSVLLVGSAYGAIRGVATLALYLAVGIVGLPVFSSGTSGWEQVSGATGGYLVGMLVAAGLVGLLAQDGWDRKLSSAVASMLTGNVVIYFFGLIWLYHELPNATFTSTLNAGLYPFIVGDLVKTYLAGALLPGAWSLVRRVRGEK